MKLFYDNLVPFMPDSIIVNEQRVPSPKLDAARKAMIMLSEFQRLHNLNALYEAVHQISIYVDVNIVDLILSSLDEEVAENTIDNHLDIAAKNLFKTISPDYDPNTFDYKYFTAILLSVAHTILVIQEQYEMEQRQAIQQSNSVDGMPNEATPADMADDTNV